MEGRAFLQRKDREALRERWLLRAGKAFERMFAEANQDDLVTFTEREDMACLLGKELAAFLLEEHAAADGPVRASEKQPPGCPKCQQPAARVTKRNEPLPERELTTRAGAIKLQREQWRCPKCRVVFFPFDHKLKLGTEGYSPRLLEKAVRQATQAASFQAASEDLRALAEVSISATHLQRLSERVGKEWAQARDQEVQAFREDQLVCPYAAAPKAAAVMVDGGRLQTRAEEAGRGVQEPAWRETKVACCLSLSAAEQAEDPQPEPPSKFLDAARVAQLAAEIKRRSRPALGRAPAAPAKKRRPQKRRRPASKKRVRTVVASMADSETFGWQVAAEVKRRGLDRARRKACVCDGQHYNWTLFEMHLLPWGFLGILDFVHLLAYLHDAAQAWKKDRGRAWKQYEQWLRWAWSGQVKALLQSLRQAATALGEPPADVAESDPRKIVRETLGYVQNNRTRMDYPRYRRLGLPTSSAAVESTIKQINRRVKGSEKFWLNGGAEAILQLRAAYLSEDDRTSAYWSRPRPHARAAGAGRLRVAA